MTLLQQYRTIFDPDPGFTTVVQHKISLIPNAKPCRQTPYRLSPDKTRWVNSQIQSLLKDGINEVSLSPWSAPILVVPKPDGLGRLCIDFRKLNAITEPDPYPMPQIDALLDRLGGARFLSKLDMNKAYWQVEIAPQDRHLTGFMTSSGHWIWKRMAVGLRNAPATLSRLVAKVFEGLEQF